MEIMEIVTASLLVLITAQKVFGQDISYLPVNPAGGCIQDVNFKEAGVIRYKTVNYRDTKRSGCLQMVKFPDRGRHRSVRIKNRLRHSADDVANDIGAIGVNTGDINHNFIGYPLEATSGIGQIGVDTGRHFFNFFVPAASSPQKDIEILGVNEGKIQSVTFYRDRRGRPVYRPYRSRRYDQPSDVQLADIGHIGTNEGEIQEVNIDQRGRGRHRARPRPYEFPRPEDQRRARPFEGGIAE